MILLKQLFFTSVPLFLPPPPSPPHHCFFPHRPYDPRIWDALASVFQALKQPYRAIKCLENILSFNDNDVSISHRIAKIYCSEVSPPILDKVRDTLSEVWMCLYWSQLISTETLIQIVMLQAALYYLKTISLDDTGNVIISDENIVEACEFLMTYFMRRNDPEKVEKYANALISYGGKVSSNFTCCFHFKIQ